MTDKGKDLAVLGGSPAFAAPLHVGRPNIGDRTRLLERINEALDRRWLTNRGPLVEELELKLAEYLGVRHCIAMCNATVGLEILIRAAGLEGEVIVPAFTFVATAHALQWQEITPVFCDIDPATHNLDPARIEAMITPRTTGIIGVHVWGRPCAPDALAEIADRHGLRLLFDAAHAFGNSYKGRMIGGFGVAEVFSFHATKVINTFEGGAVATDDDHLAAAIRLMKNFGFSGTDSVIYLGTNGKMNEISAAMGLTSLESLESVIEINRRNYELYREALADVPGLTIADYDEADRSNYQYVVAEVDAAATGLTRDQLVDVLWAENVRARRYFFPGVHRMEPYRSYFPHAGLLLPETEALTERVMSLPTGTGVDSKAIRTIGRIIRGALANADPVKAALEALPSNARAIIAGLTP
jgi:dTDP-4-amino-4,6-dideoxygalactose transaminase